MKYVWAFLVLYLAGLPGLAPAQGADDHRKVSVTTERRGGTIEVVAHNQHPFSVTLSLEVSGENYRTSRKLPLTTVLEAREEKKLFTVSIGDTTSSFAFSNQYTWFAGNIYASHNNAYIYRLPFERGTACTVGQAYNGSFSHMGKAKYAVDFVMPEGTKILAARGGIVTKVRDDSNRGGNSEVYKRDSNYIVIEHSDGTLGEYAHLKKGGVLVEPGEKVEQGQVIGLSGNTGFSSGPHLHFMVSKVLPDGHSQSLPIQFYTEDGVIKNLQQGKRYTAL